NDAEAKALSGARNLVAAGRRLLSMGPRFVVVKKGEHGAFLFGREHSLALPSYPLEAVVDPTGAGDSFAGGLMGRLASCCSDGRAPSDREWRDAMVYGTVAAS